MTSDTHTSGEWALVIGRAFIAFGSIEQSTVIALRFLPREKIQRTTQSFLLKQRIDLLLELLEVRPGAPYSTLAGLLGKAKSLADTRNLIAHNPLVLDIYERDDGNLVFRQKIASLRTEKHIAYEELEAFAGESEALAHELYECVSVIANTPQPK